VLATRPPASALVSASGRGKGPSSSSPFNNRALTAAQIQQTCRRRGEKYYLLFGVSALSGVSQSYILFQASQYDTSATCSYQPKFISLDPKAAVPANCRSAACASA